MKTQQDTQKKGLRWLMGLGVAVLTTVMVIAPIVLGLYLTEMLPLPGGVLYGLVVPMALLFLACLVKFPWGAKVIMVVCAGGLFVVSFQVMKGIREKRRHRGIEIRSETGASLPEEHPQ